MKLDRPTGDSAASKPVRVAALRALDLRQSAPAINQLVGDSTPMRSLKAALVRAARCRSTVLLTGETGTGKELAAHTIHDLGERAGRPFIAVNCGALAESLLEAELFGSVRGAFTGATSTKRGLFAAAHTGTIFLDEFGETSPAMQVRLLRVLQERRVRPVGAHDEREEIDVDVRVIAATNKDLGREVEEGRFRRDLYFRVNVQQVRLPPLRERREDVPALVRHLLVKVHPNAGLAAPAGIEPSAVRLLADYEWPGNVRELESKLECLSALAGAGGPITAGQVRGLLAVPRLTVNAGGDIEYRGVWRADETIDEFFARQLSDFYDGVRERMQGSHVRTARRFGVKPSTLYMRIGSARRRLDGRRG